MVQLLSFRLKCPAVSSIKNSAKTHERPKLIQVLENMQSTYGQVFRKSLDQNGYRSNIQPYTFRSIQCKRIRQKGLNINTHSWMLSPRSVTMLTRRNTGCCSHPVVPWSKRCVETVADSQPLKGDPGAENTFTGVDRTGPIGLIHY